MFSIEPICVSGIANDREYCRNAWMSPIEIAPEATRSPPTTATSTYCTLLRNIVSGIIRLARNCAPAEAWKSSSLVVRKRASTSAWRPKALTMLWPVNVSSTIVLSAPVTRHCAR